MAATRKKRPRIVAIAGTKGGVGKSTLAIGLAVESHEAGINTLLLDADSSQGTCLRWAALAQSREVPVPRVARAAERYYRDPDLGADFDRVIIDCPPRLGAGLKGAFAVADLVIIPCRPSVADAWGLADTLALLAEAWKVRPKLRAVVLLAGVKSRTTMAKSAREEFAVFKLPIMATEVRDRADYQGVLGGGLTLRRHAPRGEAAREMRELFDEVNGELNGR